MNPDSFSYTFNDNTFDSDICTDLLLERLAQTPLLDLPLQSRLQPMRSFQRINANVYLKHDDELAFGLGGSKVRKFASLLPFLLKERFDEVWVVGGAYSNAVAGLSLLLRQAALPYRLVLRGAADQYQPVGNHLLIRLSTPLDQCDWVARSVWPHVLKNIHQQAEAERQRGRRIYIIEEGATVEPAAPGCATLFADLLRNEEQLGCPFDHILLDAGTGMTAAVLLLIDAWVGSGRQFHVLLTAGDAESFHAVLERFRLALGQWLGETLPLPVRFELHAPAKPFGRVSASDLARSRYWAATEGIIADPVYTAPLLDWAADVVTSWRLSGTIGVLHGGGGTGLFGFGTGLVGQWK